MTLTVKVYYEWHDNKLDGSVHKRTNHIPVVIELNSTENEKDFISHRFFRSCH